MTPLPSPDSDSVWLDAVALMVTAVVCLGIMAGITVLIVGYGFSLRLGLPTLVAIWTTGTFLALSLAYGAFHLGRRHARRRRGAR